MTNLSSVADVATPASFVPQYAIAFGGKGEDATGVTAQSPLPVMQRLAAAGAMPLAGSTAASGTFGPFVPELGRSIWLTLSGSWTGQAQLMRSIDGGITLLPLTVGGVAWASYRGNANEPIGEESVAGATYHLVATIASGTLDYRVQQ